MLTPHTRERLGRLARWALAGSCTLTVGAGILAVILALAGTAGAARGYLVHSEAVTRMTDDFPRPITYFRMPVRMPFEPIAQGISYFYWQGHGGRILLPGWYNNSEYFMIMPIGQRLGPATFRPIPSPYSGLFPTTPSARSFVEPKRTLVVLLDVRMLLSTDSAGSLPASTAPASLNGNVPLEDLARTATLAYLTTAPLGQYDRLSSLLKTAPVGAVYAAGDRLEEPCRDADAAEYCKHIRSCLHGVLLVTSSADLARHAAQEKVPVIWLGPAADAPAGVTGVGTWPALIDYVRRANLREIWRPFEFGN